MDIIKSWNLTSHTCDEATAAQIISAIRNTYFVEFEEFLSQSCKISKKDPASKRIRKKLRWIELAKGVSPIVCRHRTRWSPDQETALIASIRRFLEAAVQDEG